MRPKKKAFKPLVQARSTGETLVRFFGYLVLLCSCIVAAFWLGNEYNRQLFDHSEAQRIALQERFDELALRTRMLSEQAASSSLARNVSQSSNEQSRQEITRLQQENAELSQLVTYYRSLMDAQSTSGVNFGNVELSINLAGGWSLNAMVHQVAVNHQRIRGTLSAELVGETETGETRRVEIGEQALSFKYFQRFVTDINIADDIIPKHIVLTLSVDRAEDKTYTLEWPEVNED